MARQHTVSVENGLPLRVGLQQQNIFCTGAREQHGKREVRVNAAPQFTVNKVAQTPGTKTKRNEWGDKIRDLEEGTFSTAGEDNHHHDNANQAAVERHAAVPDTEQIQRIGHKLREIVEQNITNTSPEEDAEEARIE